MEQMWKILTMALTIAVALLVYDRFLKPASQAILPTGGGAASKETPKSFDQEVAALIESENF